jgi:hypothetical protein
VCCVAAAKQQQQQKKKFCFLPVAFANQSCSVLKLINNNVVIRSRSWFVMKQGGRGKERSFCCPTSVRVVMRTIEEGVHPI